MAKPPVPPTKPYVSLFPDEFCFNCFHEGHPPFGNPCQHNDDEWLDPAVGGDPSNPPRICGCREFVDREMQGRIEVLDEKNKARAPFNPQQIENLRARQQVHNLHQYTCIAHSNRALDPGIDGMACPVLGCGYVQPWVHKVDAESRWWEGIDIRP